MKTIDPEEVSMRKAHRLKRPKYRAKGPIMFGMSTDMTNYNLMGFVYTVQLTVTAEGYFG